MISLSKIDSKPPCKMKFDEIFLLLIMIKIRRRKLGKACFKGITELERSNLLTTTFCVTHLWI